MKRILIILALGALAACQHKPVIDVQAHRGGAGLMPENTVSAMKNALDLHVNWSSTSSCPATARWSCPTTSTSTPAIPSGPTVP